MVIVFISNSFNHHERFLCDELHTHPEIEFYFIQTIPLSEERKSLGWSIDIKQYPYCICYYEEKDRCDYLIDNSDALIIGGASFNYYQKRIKENKLSFYYCESFFKQGFWHILNPKTFFRVLEKYIIPSRNKNVRMLCASAFTGLDCARIFSFRNRCYRWGHFIDVDVKKSVEKIMHLKQGKRESRGHAKILWVGRLLHLKHPEMAIKVAKELKDKALDFEMTIIGTGPMEDKIKNMINFYNLTDCVSLRGVMSPEDVRKNMEESDIFLFTSGRKEGWGAVLGESMSAGCAVVTNSVIGATPFLVQHNVNGYIFKNGDFKQFATHVYKLAKDPTLCRNLGTEALYTMREEWSPLVAANRFAMVVKALLGKKDMPVFLSGPMSKAPIMSRTWFNKYSD